MSESPTMDSLADVIRDFLAAPPHGTPQVLIESLGRAVDQVAGALPPRLFYAAVEQAQVAISITDLDANILYVNPAFVRVTGYTLDAVLGHNESLLSDKRTPRHVYQDLWGALTEQRPWSGRMVNRRRDGRRYLAELIVAPVIDASGRTSHYLGMHRDVTEMHRLEQQAANQKALLESAMDAAPVAVALLDGQQQVVLDNIAYKTLASDMGREPAGVILSAARERIGGHPGMGFADLEVTFSFGGSTRWFACSGTWFRERDPSADAFFREETNDYLLLMAKETTDLHRQQEQIRTNAMHALMAESEREQALRETLAAAAYQLRGPFNLLSAALGMLERRIGKCPESDGGIIDVLRQALNAGNEAIATFESSGLRPRNEAAVPLNLNELLRDVLAVVTPRMLALGVTVDWQPASVLPALNGFEGDLRGMFKQLVDNALDALEEVPAQRRELLVRTLTDGAGHVQVVIADQGEGIDDALRFRIFEPFFTTRGEKGHPGMGLALVQEVVNRHAATLALEPGEPRGSRVTVSLPTKSRDA